MGDQTSTVSVVRDLALAGRTLALDASPPEIRFPSSGKITDAESTTVAADLRGGARSIVGDAYAWCQTNFASHGAADGDSAIDRLQIVACRPGQLMTASAPERPGEVVAGADWPLGSHYRLGSLLAHEAIHQALFVRETAGSPVRPGSLAYSPWRAATRPGRLAWHAFWTFACQIALLAETMPADPAMAERETMSHNPAILSALAPYNSAKCRVFRAISTNAELFEYSFTLSPEEISARNTALLEAMLSARRLRVEADGGTDLSIKLDNSHYRWISNRGIWRPGKFVVVPSGEIATFAADISGTLVADYAINVNTRLNLDARLAQSPVTVRIEENRAVAVESADPEMTAYLDEALSRPNARIVGELGFGTNAGVTASVAMNSHTNERRPGVHLGFGQHNQREEVAGYFCDIHVDLCARGGRVWLDDSAEPLDLERIEPSASPHPPVFDDEDVLSPEPLDGDCCGLYAG